MLVVKPLGVGIHICVYSIIIHYQKFLRLQMCGFETIQLPTWHGLWFESRRCGMDITTHHGMHMPRTVVSYLAHVCNELVLERKKNECGFHCDADG